jgi:4-alpha-glucanotransferase
MKRQPEFPLSQRAAGVLLHPISLPGPHGCGDLGRPAREFIDFLAAAGQRWWQMLPLGPPGLSNSPYSAFSAFAGNPLFVSLAYLANEGLLNRKDFAPAAGLTATRVAYPAVKRYRMQRLRRAFGRFSTARAQPRAFQQFCRSQRHWLDDYALYAALKRARGGRSWLGWPEDLRLRKTPAMAKARAALAQEIEFEKFVQFEFAQQWAALRAYARQRGVALLGDVPVYVALDSADVWAHRELFRLDRDGRPSVVSGVPPDYFNRNGQLWGHPHYRWPRLVATGFAWWVARFRHTFQQFDAVRVDHFLGFYRMWAVPATAKTARRGHWVRTPGRALLQALCNALGPLQILAEDLGAVTPQALALRDEFNFPGMRVLQFAFGDDGPASRYNQPQAYPRNCAVYPGTHDNETAVGWLASLRAAAKNNTRQRTIPGVQNSASRTIYERVLRYTGTSGREINWDLIRIASMSVANLAIAPAQDLLGLGNEARMNFPGQPDGNWDWRLRPGALDKKIAARLRGISLAYDRVP